MFYVLTFAVAATWLVGGVLSGPLHLGYIPFRGTLRRPVITPIVIGLLVAAVFLVGALVVREIGPLRDYVENVLAHARKGNLALVTVVTLVNGAAEEVFFRGALYRRDRQAPSGTRSARSSTCWSRSRRATRCSCSPR